ncbi:MAG: type II toxin-antitoxin system RatA family toxin [Pseudomonadota bacterium]|nr:type II toxin-antitoxin system RatA family toxin [Pseudomonadota bacterium]
MYTIERSALVPHSARQMFDLVNDVSGYPDFLPWCGGTCLIEESAERITASITIAFKGVHKEFTTSNRITQGEMIEIELVDGPFSHLVGHWRFKALDESACKISLALDFGFSNRVAGMVVGPVFKHIADSMVESFCRRASEVYGGSVIV